jgi:hypothetical protein
MRPAVQSVISQNSKRWNTLLQPYDPILGIGSPKPRLQIKIDDQSTVSIPVEMGQHAAVEFIQKSGSMEKAAAAVGKTIEEVRNNFARVRCKYDFEFWAASCVTIKAKRPKKDALVDGTEGDTGIDKMTVKKKFVLNRPQRKMLAVLERMRLSGVSIRVILLKARQWGGSTLVQIYISWLQLFHRTDWNAMIVADAKEKALNIRSMYKLVVQDHPADVIEGVTGKLQMMPWEQTHNFKYIPGRGNLIGVASVQNPDAPRSFTTHLLHLSEVGLWKSTPSVNAESLATSLEGGIVDGPYTLCVMESTAKGVGTYFHREWQKAINKKSNYEPVFVSWFEDPNDYNVPVKRAAEFIVTWSDYEWFLWESGATIEHIAWYRKKRVNFDSDWQMQSEYPTNPQEAFQSTGNRIFAPNIVIEARKTCKDPIAVGNLNADTIKGPGAFKNIEFVPAANGYLSIWNYPNNFGIERSGKLYTNRYCAFLDTGGKSKESDYNSMSVLDRILTMYGGVPYVAAEFHGHFDPDLVAWYAARIARWYDNALLAVEVNKLYQDSGDDTRGHEANYGVTVLDEIKDYYENLYYRIQPEQIQEKWNGVLGFHTNKETKPMIIKELNAALRDHGYEERNIAACDEFDYYEQKKDGSMGAVEGQHDDRVISRAGALWLSGKMDPVEEIDIQRKSGTAKPGGFGIFP